MKGFLIFLFLISASIASAQTMVLISGKVEDEQGQELEGVNIQIIGQTLSVRSDKNGNYSLKITGASSEIKVSYRLMGYLSQTIELTSGNTVEVIRDVVLKKSLNQLDAVTVSSESAVSAVMTDINPEWFASFPSVSSNFESLLKTLPGVSSNNELSSQYSVRGGNFDENLIYVNDIEIFRPLLVRSGQQEGLSFINPELVSRASFSAGGFEAKYGDKLSSVLDIRYGRPDSSVLTASAGLLGLSSTAKLPFKNSYLLAGFRSKTNQNILRNQPVRGSYQPRFYDFQVLFNQEVSPQLSFSVYGNVNLSRFTLLPESRETVFGTINEQLRLKINYSGKEADSYQSLASTFSVVYKPNENLWFKWLNSAFGNIEKEAFDIEGRYVFDELVSDSENGNVRTGRGIGSYYDYARNSLKTSIYSSEFRAYFQNRRSLWESGLRYQHDDVRDNLNEYHVIDSAGYSLPQSEEKLVLTDVVFARNAVSTTRISAFLQNTFTINRGLTFSAGIRTNYNSFTDEFLLSPRLTAVYRPSIQNRNLWRFSAGEYSQPPFYRELRNFDGTLNTGAKSQRSIHLLAANEHSISRKGILSKLSSEIYFKKLNNLIPYKLENLRVRYFADQQSRGYVLGADVAISREFVPGLESSFRLSLMKTAEDIENDSYEVRDANGKVTVHYPGYLRRPTDQRINFSAFFQDRLFDSPSYKVHLTMLYGSAMPTGPGQSPRYLDKFKIPAYRRVDIGFSKDFLEGGTGRKLSGLNRYFSSFIAYAEVFNLLNINNTVSFLWLKDVSNNQFAVPNYLTSRQLNIKFIAKIKN